MAQPLIFKFGEKEFSFQPEKIDRSQLYGRVDTEALDENGRPCRLVTLAGDGRTIIDSGGTALVYLSPTGEWRDKSDLKPVDTEGNEITPVPSTFKSAVVLQNKADIDEYLSHNIRAIYLLQYSEDMTELAQELKSGVIYSFPFSFRGSLEADTGFLIAGADGNIFLTVGKKTDIKFIGFEQASEVETLEEETEEETEDIDFSMM